MRGMSNWGLLFVGFLLIAYILKCIIFTVLVGGNGSDGVENQMVTAVDSANTGNIHFQNNYRV